MIVAAMVIEAAVVVAAALLRRQRHQLRRWRSGAFDAAVAVVAMSEAGRDRVFDGRSAGPQPRRPRIQTR